jgi:prepilin-type N-terminal cleavage/methylation domain-containing protein
LSIVFESYLLSESLNRPKTIMKIHPSRRDRGFTLIEILVVIAIIAVLAGVGFSAGNAAIQKAKKTTALNTCESIESAVNQFYSEYGYMPVTGLNADVTYKTDSTDANGVQLLTVILGYETAAPILNTRGIKFLSVPSGKKVGAAGGRDGLISTSVGSPAVTTVIGLYDPWGGPYRIRLDGDYDEAVTPDETGMNPAVTLSGRRVAVWSEGADSAENHNTGGTSADDVKTW